MEDKDPELGVESILKLVKALDSHIPDPSRDLGAPLLMCVETAVSVPGRGTVVTGTITQGTVSK